MQNLDQSMRFLSCDINFAVFYRGIVSCKLVVDVKLNKFQWKFNDRGLFVRHSMSTDRFIMNFNVYIFAHQLLKGMHYISLKV
jgi:hypothetical protein